MRHLRIYLSFLTTLAGLTACTKTKTAKLPGQWNLISDSAYQGVGFNNHPVDYTGRPGDYFEFSANGNVYTKEGNVLNTLTYQQLSNTRIILSGFGLILNGVPDTSTITGLTSSLTSPPTGDTIVIESPWFPTPGGLFWRKVTLSR